MIYGLIAAVLVAVDQLVKYLVMTNIPLGEHVPFVDVFSKEFQRRFLQIFPYRIQLRPVLYQGELIQNTFFLYIG